MILCAAHHGGENLVIVLAPAQVAGNTVREFRASGIRIHFKKTNRRHHETRHAERALETLLIDDALLHRMQRAVGLGETFDGLNFFVAHRVRKHRA